MPLIAPDCIPGVIDALIAEVERLRAECAQAYAALVTVSEIEDTSLPRLAEMVVDKVKRLNSERNALRSLLQEWRATPFFETRDEWEQWVADYGARVDATLAAIARRAVDAEGGG